MPLINVSEGFVHVILMRFNVRTKHPAEVRDAGIRSKKDWLDQRFELFEQICLPTIKGQSSKNFNLHVYFDISTPESYKQRFAKITEGCSFIQTIFCEFFDAEIAAIGIRQRYADDSRFVLTTRLDNDDGLHRDFVSNLQRHVRPVREAINFPRGLVLADGAVYRSEQESNAFISVLEARDTFKTVLQVSHNQLSKHFALRNVDADPMWLQHVHGGNVSNKIRGSRLSTHSIPAGYESIELVNLVRPVGTATAVFENSTVGTIRAIRDVVARAIRSARAK